MPHGQNCGDSVDKWQVLQHLRLIRAEIGLSDRSLSVLAALLSFHPARGLAGDQALIVWPSNATLSQRANGMPESTLRRHLSNLIAAGLITRHASPNGKRYARRTLEAEGLMAYGFSLTPLHARAEEFAEIAHEVELRAIAVRDHRDAITLALRHAAEVVSEEQQPALEALRRSLRRALPLPALRQLLNQINALLPAVTHPQMSGSDSQNERHIQESIHINIDKNNTEIPKPILMADVGYAKSVTPVCKPVALKALADPLANLSCEKVLSAFPQLQTFSPEPINSWSALHQATDLLAPMIGLSAQLMARAKQVLGLDGTALTLGALLQGFDKIRNPAGYLTHLLAKAQVGHFSPSGLLQGKLAS